jgi:hypothetical protein
VITINNLFVDNGVVRTNSQGQSATYTLAGNITLGNHGMTIYVDAGQTIVVTANIGDSEESETTIDETAISTTNAAVPEPSAGLLLAIAAASLIMLHGRHCT